MENNPLTMQRTTKTSCAELEGQCLAQTHLANLNQVCFSRETIASSPQDQSWIPMMQEFSQIYEVFFHPKMY